MVAEGRNWRGALVRATVRLEPVAGDGAEREARWLLREVAGVERAWPVLLDEEPTHADLARFDSMVDRRALGEPLQYVIGHWPFRSVDLIVDERALIPRPETEQVVEVALAELDGLGVAGPVVVDLGTGTGAIALSIAVERPEVWVLGIEASRPALELAMENRDRVGLGVKRVAFAAGSWFSMLPGDLHGAIDLIVTNPPYVATGDDIDPSVRDWEPSGALFAGVDGLDDLRVTISQAPEWLAPHGVLVAEIGATQSDAVRALATDAGFVHAEVRPDFAGHDRILIARRHGAPGPRQERRSVP
ncbi:MAG: peptide chain release factor N(5)-glutamine methyltransferase [Actinobacteria bacterium]|nr:peptide chain release factor N(5)-glutamine methyltransferase [Actinomycetota bacterium]